MIHNALQAIFLKDHIAAENDGRVRRLRENASRFLQGLLGDSGPFQDPFEGNLVKQLLERKEVRRLIPDEFCVPKLADPE